MVYTFEARFDRYQAIKIAKVIVTGALARQSATRITETLKIKGISYRRIEMLHDIRRARGVEFAKTYETKISAGYYFDLVFEPFREKYGLTSAKASDIFNKKKAERWEDEEELDMIEEITDRYNLFKEFL